MMRRMRIGQRPSERQKVSGSVCTRQFLHSLENRFGQFDEGSARFVTTVQSRLSAANIVSTAECSTSSKRAATWLYTLAPGFSFVAGTALHSSASNA